MYEINAPKMAGSRCLVQDLGKKDVKCVSGDIRMLECMDTQENIFLSHVSALACWAVVGHRGLDDQTRTVVRNPTTSVKNTTSILNLGLLQSKFMGKLPKPIDILVPSHGRTFKSDLVTCHLCTHDVPPGGFRRLTDHIYISSPELTFVQMGTLLTDTQLALVGMMLCGKYAIAPNQGRELIERQPLATLESLEAMVDTCESCRVRGATAARRALGMCVEGSRSPRESLLFLLLCNKSSMGSYELARPEINRPIELNPAGVAIVGTSELTPDLCWHNKGVLMEYDSWDNHNTPRKLADDDLRMEAFRQSGWNAITLRTKNVDYPDRLDRMVRGVLAPAIGAITPPMSMDFVRCRTHLRDEVMAFDPYVPSSLARKRTKELMERRKTAGFVTQ